MKEKYYIYGESIGFVIEVLLFIFSGYFFALDQTISFLFLFLAFVMAIGVGKLIAHNTITKFKEETNLKWI